MVQTAKPSAEAPRRVHLAASALPALVLLVSLLFCSAPSLAKTPRASRWAWATRALGKLVEGKHAEAVKFVGQARVTGGFAALDAMVGLIAAAGGELAAGRHQLDGAIKRGSTDPAVLYWAGRLTLAAGDRRRALKRFEQAIAVGGDQPVLQMGYALALIASGQKNKARLALSKVAAQTPNLLDPSLFPTAASGAVALLPAVMRKFPHRVQLRRTLAYLNWKLGHVWAAMLHFRWIAAQRKNDGDAAQMIARCWLALGEKKPALVEAERAVAVAPDLPATYHSRGLALLANGAAERAVKDLRRAANAMPRNAEVLLALGRACTVAEKPKCAARFFKYTLIRAPKNAAARFGLALLAAQRGEHKEALKSFALAIASDPSDPRYYEGAAQSAQTLGDKKRARKLLAEAKTARRYAKRFARRREAALLAARKMADALGKCGCWSKKGCKASGPNCDMAVKQLPNLARIFFLGHLRARSGKPPMLPAIILRLRPRKLLLNDPTSLKIKGKTVGAHPYLLRTTLPMVPPKALR